MSFCCNNPQTIGCFKSCGPIQTGLTAPSAGTYNLHLELFGGVEILNFEDMLSGEEFVIDGPLNEQAIYKFKIYDDQGDLVEFSGYSCFKFETFLAQGEDVIVTNPCDDPDCVNGKELLAYSFIDSLTGSTHGGDSHLDIAITKTYTDPSDVLGPENYVVDWGDPVLGVHSINSGSASAHMAGVPSGVKIGTVYGPGCYMQFAYRVQSQKVTWFTTIVHQGSNLVVDCGEVKTLNVATSTLVTYTDFGKALDPLETPLIDVADGRSVPVGIILNAFNNDFIPAVNSCSQGQTYDLAPELTLSPINVLYTTILMGGAATIISDNKIILKCKSI